MRRSLVWQASTNSKSVIWITNRVEQITPEHRVKPEVRRQRGMGFVR